MEGVEYPDREKRDRGKAQKEKTKVRTVWGGVELARGCRRPNSMRDHVTRWWRPPQFFAMGTLTKQGWMIHTFCLASESG